MLVVILCTGIIFTLTPPEPAILAPLSQAWGVGGEGKIYEGAIYARAKYSHRLKPS
jgi:hypothetical protein